MPTIAALTTFTSNTQAKAAEVNANFSTIRTTVNSFAAFVDTACTITGAWTFSTAPTISGAMSFGAAVTITTGGLTISAGGFTVTGNSSVAGTLTATTFSGSGASLTNIPAANITGTLPAISGANLTNLNGSNISSGTVAAARLPTTLTSAITFSAGGAAVVVSNQGFVNFSAGAGAPGSAAAFNFNSDYNLVGANPAPALADAPIAGGGYRWVRVAYNGIGVGYIPMLV